MIPMVGKCSKHGEFNGSLSATCPLCLAAVGVGLGVSSDARAQLWARVYAAQFDVRVHQPDWHETGARHDATLVADAAVRDFDEHYLGGKR